ncbi:MULTISPECIES: ankyrin repeat domain-containing protein [Chryseobacterium]|uniref:Ankyrin repeat protein n=1 Tax=Chryseobacterium camelliae TaxID=1265445 RepID=A0ABU0TKT6_9FLAO|nr:MULTISPECIES: ankyrin repeat domain-containing protein [Chryseobacterium]MDT3408481.1 ankyrin repeat protein [Pseudacidovorax intermedius]MDQ1097663.1 ankyrin repeat protein [Chryseobacterium camelliae]MDQ1101592.1 ankyrin repeat protein [Chryseobacterium sp. SORGH_AS_1048]MDR6085035.1 ankyrin repeat protein [Chryseobacterium sp. SORGH_AS_0909]MDR6129390.1 ankyrin repeat protein [Chryseobacterium sp. SORGH_AS_1175]
MNKNSIKEAFQHVRYGEIDEIKSNVNKNNVNDFINEYNENLLQEAISSNSESIFDYLLNCGIDVNHQDKNGKTALHFSVAHGNYLFTKKLLDFKPTQIDLKDNYGNNAMWVATFNARGKYDFVELLKKYGADSNSKNNSHRSAIDFANQIGDNELIKILT